MDENKASNDSEESVIDADNPAQTTSNRGDLEHSKSGKFAHNELSGHYDPRQRRIYLITFGSLLVSSLIGLILILAWMSKLRAGIGISDPDQLGNLHPVLMYTFMFSLNIYAVLVYRTHFDQPKDRLKWAHAILSGLNIVFSLLGVYAMFRSHQLKDMANFYSLHSWIGVLTNGFYLTQFIIGFTAFLKPGLAQHKRAYLMPWHRLFGSTILLLAAAAALTGIAEMAIFQGMKDYTTFAPITFIANISGLCVIITTALSLYLLTAPSYLRPRQPEEEPLRR